VHILYLLFFIINNKPNNHKKADFLFAGFIEKYEQRGYASNPRHPDARDISRKMRAHIYHSIISA